MAFRRSYAKPKARKAPARRKAYSVKRTRSARGQTVRIELVHTGMGGVARPVQPFNFTRKGRVF
jgi:hypothetical protein